MRHIFNRFLFLLFPLILFGSGRCLFLSIIKCRYFISVMKNVHFSEQIQNPKSWIRYKVYTFIVIFVSFTDDLISVCTCYRNVSEHRIHGLLKYFRSWLTPNWRRSYWYKPRWVFMVSSFFNSSFISIYNYTSAKFAIINRSNNFNFLYKIQLFTNICSIGARYQSTIGKSGLAWGRSYRDTVVRVYLPRLS